MNILWLFNSLGSIVGSLMLAALLTALCICGIASLKSATPKTHRLAVRWSFGPLVVGVFGLVLGMAFCLSNGIAISWLNLSKCVLAGAVVTIVPLTWALWIRRRGRGDSIPAPVR